MPYIINLLNDDMLGTTREDFNNLPSYEYAFKEILKDRNNHVIVAKLNNKTVGTLQLTFIRNLTFQGGLRAQIEGVRTLSQYRGLGIGKRMISHAIKLAKENNCHLVQLTANQQRSDSIKFYKTLGFIPSHIGLKLYL